MRSREVSATGVEMWSGEREVRSCRCGNFKGSSVNGSHGCIGLSTANAKWFFGRVNCGDPVTVVKSVDTVATNNGYGDWNVDWGA